MSARSSWWEKLVAIIQSSVDIKDYLVRRTRQANMDLSFPHIFALRWLVLSSHSRILEHVSGPRLSQAPISLTALRMIHFNSILPMAFCPSISPFVRSISHSFPVPQRTQLPTCPPRSQSDSVMHPYRLEREIRD